MKGPVQRVTAIDVPMPYAKLLEDNVTPKPDSIIKAVKKALMYK